MASCCRADWSAQIYSVMYRTCPIFVKAKQNMSCCRHASCLHATIFDSCVLLIFAATLLAYLRSQASILCAAACGSFALGVLADLQSRLTMCLISQSCKRLFDELSNTMSTESQCTLPLEQCCLVTDGHACPCSRR